MECRQYAFVHTRGKLPPRELAAEELVEALVVRPVPLTKQIHFFDHRLVPAHAESVFGGSSARGERVGTFRPYFLPLAISAFAFKHSTRPRVRWARGHYATHDTGTTKVKHLCKKILREPALSVQGPTPPYVLRGVGDGQGNRTYPSESALPLAEGSRPPNAVCHVEFLTITRCF